MRTLCRAAGPLIFPVQTCGRETENLTGGVSTAATGSGWHWSFRLRANPAGTTQQHSEADRHPTRRSPRMARLEAALLVADGALTHRRLAQFATLADAAEAKRLIDRLNAAYDAAGCAFRVEQVAGGYRLMTRPAFALWLDRLHNRQARAKLSPPMMETLAIVAYRQPVTRAEIETIRGVQSSEMLRHLMDRGLLRITGEEDSLGRPFLYGTTRQFLEDFGLGKLDDLPMATTLRRIATPDAGTDSTDSDDPDGDSSDSSGTDTEDADTEDAHTGAGKIPAGTDRTTHHMEQGTSVPGGDSTTAPAA